jgi:small GTP-binding protein
MVAEISESCRFSFKTNSGIAFHPHLPILATLGENDTIIRIWELDEDVLLGKAKESVNYTTAKLVLVGDSGVGKTGLGWRLAHGEFKEHASTHGQQFWPVSQLNLKRKDGTDCEAVLWDLAGQHVYRQVHSIFLDNVSAAMVLFDPTNRQEPLKGAQFWLEQLKGKGALPPTVLVGARVDRGAPALSQTELDQFCQRYGIKGKYISTSALTGDGLDELLDILKEQIPWDEMTATVTTVTFKRIKDYVLSLKEKTDRKGVLVTPDALRAQLQATDSEWNFTDAEMMTAVGHLETHGYVSILSNSAGERFILLTPELLASLAASIMLLADKNPHELGAISETELLGGNVSFDDLKGLDNEERQILIDAAILRFLEHNICFRETLNSDTLLIFPSLIKQKRPLQDDLPATDDISYVVRGRVENLYASLVVLLGYTPSFMRINQWQNQAQYEMREGEMCGFRMIEEREGEIEFVLYYGDAMQKSGRDKFQELFEQFLYQRDVEVTRFPPVVCSNNHRLERNTVIRRVREGKNFAFCDECGDKVDLPDFEKPQTIGIGASPWLQIEEAMARLRSLYEQYLTNIKSYRRGWAIPRAYISRLPEQEQWAGKLIHDLRDAGVYIVDKAEEIQADDFVIVLSTSAYEKAYKTSTSAISTDAQTIRARLASAKKKVLSLACEGKMSKHEFEECDPGNFCDETHYAVSFFNLVMELYAIPLHHKGFEPLRQSLHHQWEQTLAGKEVPVETSTELKLFISYSHEDETFKDELATMLAGLHRRGIVDVWHDRRMRGWGGMA